jgi:hypothetical protein
VISKEPLSGGGEPGRLGRVEVVHAGSAADQHGNPGARQPGEPGLPGGDGRIVPRSGNGSPQRERHLDDVVATAELVLRRRDDQIVVGRIRPGPPDVNQADGMPGAGADPAGDGFVAAARGDDEARPGRAQRRPRGGAEALEIGPEQEIARQLGRSVAQVAGLEVDTERLGEREHLVVVAGLVPEQRPHGPRRGLLGSGGWRADHGLD